MNRLRQCVDEKGNVFLQQQFISYLPVKKGIRQPPIETWENIPTVLLNGNVEALSMPYGKTCGMIVLHRQKTTMPNVAGYFGPDGCTREKIITDEAVIVSPLSIKRIVDRKDHVTVYTDDDFFLVKTSQLEMIKLIVSLSNKFGVLKINIDGSIMEDE